MNLSQKRTRYPRHRRAVSLQVSQSEERAGLRTLLLAAAVLALFWLGSAHARAALEIKNEVFQEVEVKGPDGKADRKSVPASLVLPGTEVQYVVTYTNKGDQTAGQVAITNPIPKELEYVSAAGGEAEVSVDGKTYGPLASLKVTEADGSERPAKASDVTHVRWRIANPVKPGEQGKVSFRAKLK